MTLQPIFAAPKLAAAHAMFKNGDVSSQTALPKDSFQAGEAKQPQLNPRDLGERQFADFNGRVKNLALMLSSYAGGETRRQMLKAYETLFLRMEPDTKFTIAVESIRDKMDVERVIANANVPNPERITFVDPKSGKLTVWARDMMVPLELTKDPNHVGLLEQTPLHDWHDNDSAVPGAICAQNPTILLDQDKRLVTDGGDVMSNTQESFVGYYSLSATAQRMARQLDADPAAKAAFIAEYESRTGKDVVDEKGPIIFPVRQQFKEVSNPTALNWELVENPAFVKRPLGPNQVTASQMLEERAEDLFEEKFGKPVTVLGRDVPTTANHKEEPASDHMDMGCTPIDDKTFFVGDPGLAKQIVSKMSDAELKDAERILSEAAGKPVRLPRAGDRNRDNQEDFDAYANTLTEKGYNVIRMPHAEPGLSRSYVSYNNCLMENFTREDGTQVRRVFLPVYNIPKLDDYATETWQSQGYEVIPMPLGALSQRWGALRCISNWLERSSA